LSRRPAKVWVLASVLASVLGSVSVSVLASESVSALELAPGSVMCRLHRRILPR
jgi:hypothetical protein